MSHSTAAAVVLAGLVMGVPALVRGQGQPAAPPGVQRVPPPLAPPLTSPEKLKLFVVGTYDPAGLAARAFEAGVLDHGARGFCGYGSGLSGYGKCYGANLLDADVAGFVGGYALASLWHQDPRYFRRGTGSIGSRVLYALSRVLIARNDAGAETFASAALGGTVAASLVSNFYYPKADRGVGHSFDRVATSLAGTAFWKLEAEFLPDIKRKLRR